jgi:hypothetical protein
MAQAAAAMTALLLSLALVASARAAPPAGANPAFALWFESLVQKNGISCCGNVDCREETRVKSPSNSLDRRHWYVFIGKDKFGPDAPDEMVVVPEEVVSVDKETATLRPPGPVVCWHRFSFGSGAILCFRLPRASG